MADLDAFVAVVTGASRGIGRAIAAELVRQGATVVISGRDEAMCTSTAAAIGATPVVADATDRVAARRPCEVALDRFDRLDVLVNNVGGNAGGDHRLIGGDDEAFEETMVLNLHSAFWATRAAIGAMATAGFGRIINIGSGASHRAVASVGYTAAKHGLVGFTKQVAQTHASDGVTSNCVFPGWTNTDLVDFEAIAARSGATVAEARAKAEAASAQRRILEPEEVAPLVAFLASPAAGAITGQTIGADGGFGL